MPFSSQQSDYKHDGTGCETRENVKHLFTLVLEAKKQKIKTNKQQNLQVLIKDRINCPQSLQCKTRQILKIKWTSIYSIVIFS